MQGATPACCGFSIIAKIIPGREFRVLQYAKNIEEAVAGQPDILAVLKLHYLRWNLFDIKGETYFQYMGIFDTDFDKYTEDAVGIFAGQRAWARAGSGSLGKQVGYGSIASVSRRPQNVRSASLPDMLVPSRYRQTRLLAASASRSVPKFRSAVLVS